MVLGMKICFISSYPPEKEGVGLYTKRLVDNFNIKEIDISVLTFNYKITYKEKNIFQVLGASPKNIIKTYTSLTSIKPDIIHIQYATPVYRIYSLILWILLCIYKKRNKTKLVVTFHEVRRETDLLRLPGIKYYSFISLIADHILVHTEEARHILIKRCRVKPQKISRVPHGLFSINSNLLEGKRHLRKINNVNLTNKKIILFFGYIHIDKGIEDLIAALDILYREYPEEKSNSILLIAGDIRPRKGIFKFFGYLDILYKKKLNKLIRNFRLEDNIAFLGYIKDKDVFPLLNSATVIVMPYKKVEQSGVLNLALNSNIPIIATNIGGLQEILGNTGLTVEPKNIERLMQKINIVINSKYDDTELCKKYARIKKLNSLQITIKQHIKLYTYLSNS